MRRPDSRPPPFAVAPPSALLLGLLFASTPGLSAPAAEEVIAYSTMRPSNQDLYLFDRPGAAPRRLTRHPALDYNPAFSPDGRWVVFTSERSGNPDLWALDLQKGGDPILLAGGPAMQDAASVSPDGKRIAFVSTRDGFADIFTMPFRPGDDTAHGEAKNLTAGEAGDFRPAFSPDGGKIAFSSNREEKGAAEIYLMNADGSGVKRLTKSWGWDGSPAWSADGETIYYYSQQSGPTAIWRMEADGSNPERITLQGGRKVSPAAAPGGRIVFSARADGGKWRIVSVDAAGENERVESNGSSEWDCREPAYDPSGSGRMICHGAGPVERPRTMGGRVRRPFAVAGGPDRVELPDRTLRLHPVRGMSPGFDPSGRRVVSDDHFDRIVVSQLDGRRMRELYRPPGGGAFAPAWSADGAWIAFSVGPTFGGTGAAVDVWRIGADGGGAVNLTPDSEGNDAFPRLSPDGRRIVFRSGRHGNHDIYLMDADGGNPRRLTDSRATDTMPDFSPRGDQVAFASRRDRNFEIYTLDLDPEGNPGVPVRRTDHPALDLHPKYSPDGRWLVFTSSRFGVNDEEPLAPISSPQPYGEIFALRLADGLVVRLTHNRWEDGTPAWGPPAAR